MSHLPDQHLESELHLCALMIEQIKANARILFGCRHTYDVAIGHGDDGGYRALLFQHDHSNDSHSQQPKKKATDSGDDGSNKGDKGDKGDNIGGNNDDGSGGHPCAPDGPKGNKFQELRRAHALLRLAIAGTRREAVRSVLAWTEGLVSGA